MNIFSDLVLSILASIIATFLLGTASYKIVKKYKQKVKLKNSFNSNSNNNNYFNDSSQQINAEKIIINQSFKDKDDWICSKKLKEYCQKVK